MSERSWRSWIMVRVVSRYSAESDTSSPRVPLRLEMRDITLSADTSTRAILALGLEHGEREVLPRVRLDVGEELAQLDHGEGGLAIQRRVRHEQPQGAAAVGDARHHAVRRHEHADETLLVLVCGI